MFNILFAFFIYDVCRKYGKMNWFTIKNIETVDSPALIVYKERVRQNIQSVLNMREAALLRPHVKTNKMAEVCSMMLDAGITKFKCATIAEAEMLGMIQAPDVLLAYQPTPVKAKRLALLIKQYPATKFSCLIDDADNAENISHIFTNNNITVDVFIDLNVGQNRTGIKPSNAFDLFETCTELKGITIIGLHVYDGHIRDTDVDARKQKTDVAFQQAVELSEKITSFFNIKLKIVAGGSPTFPVHAQRKDVECSPGTFVFWDYGYKTQFPDEPFEYAALVISRVISVVDEHTICVDLGHKSVAAENVIEKRVYFLNAENIQPLGQSEEHLVLRVEDAALYKVGDVLYGVPYHICPTVALYEKAVIVENNEAVGEWKVVARDRKINA
ncbi:D-TA family PLP-dependent enzyme [Parafilimonas terrae]|uniref:D-serine deaminase, pyridoxal phosphate-dependent n=1 Tax=Parafilimonas terrae TaxID=1465490 RepID=A0A1I5Y902_9BACT|nr:D-TA family PLP-dependent enzyme [Parafilimonas terrae]SFQ40664.1 D-serine deaminase, pyridoxal phosphate-dependent [Parafilimonas terrae]